MVTGTYSGTGAAQNITGLGFAPDVVIFKATDGKVGALKHWLMSAHDGKDTAALTNNYGSGYASIGTDGFQVVTDAGTNTNSVTYHYAAFMAKPSLMHAASYRGDGSDGRNISFESSYLSSSSPSFLLIAQGDTDGSVQVRASITSGDSATNAGGTTSTDIVQGLFAGGFQVGASAHANTVANYYYAAWTTVAGSHVVGSYKGLTGDGINRSTLGFQPALALVYSTSNATDLRFHTESMGDSTDTSGGLNGIANAADMIQALQSAGFQTGSNNAVNGSGRTYVYAAFKEATSSAIELNRFQVRQEPTGTTVEWTTGSEVRNLGFHLWREDERGRVRLGERLLPGSMFEQSTRPARARTQGARTYRVVDASAAANSRYFLEAVDLNGSRSLHGPAATSAGAEPSTELGAVRASPQRADTTVNMPVERARFSPRPPRGPDVPRFQPMAQPSALDTFASCAGGKRLDVPAPGIYQAPVGQGSEGAHVTVNGAAMASRAGVDGTLLEFFVPPASLGTAAFVCPTSDPADAAAGWPTLPFEEGLAPVRIAEQTLSWHEAFAYVPALLNGSGPNVLGPPISTGGAEVTLTTPGIEGPARLFVALEGFSVARHVVSVSLNEQLVGQLIWTDANSHEQWLNVPSGALHDGDNTLTLRTASDADVVIVDRVDLVASMPVDITASSSFATVTGPIELIVRAPSLPRALDYTGATPVELSILPLSSGEYRVSVPTPGSRNLYLFTEPSAPASERALGAPAWLTENHAGARLVVIAPKRFAGTLAPLLTARRSEGWTTELVHAEDVYDAFNFGNKSGSALRAFLKHANSHWAEKPTHVLLAGAASGDTENRITAKDELPTSLMDGRLLEIATDDPLADLDDDGIPDLAVGRFPAQTTDDLIAMINKTLDAPAHAFAQALVLVDQDRGEGFGKIATGLNDSLQGGANVRTYTWPFVNASPPPPVAASDLVFYVGHGAFGSVTDDVLPGDAGSGSLAVHLSCMTGGLQLPTSAALAEAQLASPSGPWAVLASSGASYAADQESFGRQIAVELKTAPTLGDAVLQAKRRVPHPSSEVPRSWILLGDPSAPLHGLAQSSPLDEHEGAGCACSTPNRSPGYAPWLGIGLAVSLMARRRRPRD